MPTDKQILDLLALGEREEVVFATMTKYKSDNATYSIMFKGKFDKEQCFGLIKEIIPEVNFSKSGYVANQYSWHNNGFDIYAFWQKEEV